MKTTLGTECRNLVGVFARVFPGSVALVRGNPEKRARVNYYSHDYVIVGTAGDGAYAYRVHLAE